VPALFDLHRKGRLPSGSRFVGFARRAYDHEEFRRVVREGVEQFSASSFEKAAWEAFAPNVLSLCIQSDEGIHLRFETKVPDTVAEMRSVDMMFHYLDTFGSNRIPDAHACLPCSTCSWETPRPSSGTTP
jgi:glucose-6-phosphate 1-dehydrogenase